MYDENNRTGSPQLSENYKINFINLLINRNGTTKKRKEMKVCLLVVMMEENRRFRNVAYMQEHINNLLFSILYTSSSTLLIIPFDHRTQNINN